jgi:hypothetical protein
MPILWMDETYHMDEIVICHMDVIYHLDEI